MKRKMYLYDFVVVLLLLKVKKPEPSFANNLINYLK